MVHSAVRCSEMEIRGATNRENYDEDNGFADGSGGLRGSRRLENKSGPPGPPVGSLEVQRK